MRFYSNMGAAALLVMVSACDTTWAAQNDSIVFQNVSTIDAVDGLQKGMTVVVHGNRITKVAPASELSLPGTATTIDGSGKYLIPGLWDAHVHLTFERDVTPAMFKLFLVNGITSVRDTGGQLDLVLHWRQKA